MPTAPTPVRASTHSIAAATPQPAASSNPFANTSFASKVSTPIPSKSSSVNPFATVSFAATPADKTIGFGKTGPIATSTKKLRPVITSAPEPFTPLRQGAKIDMDDFTKKNLEALKGVQKEADFNPITDYTQLLDKYIQNRNPSLTGNGGENFSSPAVSVPQTTFSIAPAPAVANGIIRGEEESEDLSPSIPSFSFASAPATPAAPKAFTGFSFGNGTSASNTTAPVAADVETKQEESTENDDDDDATPGVVVGELAENEQELHSVRAKYLRRVASEADSTKMEWKSFAAGVLRLYKNNDDDKCKIVLRDAAGKVRLNLNIAKGTSFRSLPAKNDARSVQFLSIMDEKVGLEQFILKTKQQHFDELLKALESMA